METTNTDSTSKPFSRREWLFAGALVMLIEYWIFSVSHAVSGEQAIVNYVSFASTIASILLAVIAIIYSFVQTDSQQKTGNAIASQIDHLKNASIELRNSKEQLETQIDRFSGLAENLNGLQGLVGNQINSVQESIQEMQKKLNLNSDVHVAPTFEGKKDVFDVDLILLAILHSTFACDLFTTALYQFSKKADSKYTWIDFIDKHFARPLHSDKESMNEYVRNLSVGSSTLMILSTLGFVVKNQDKLELSKQLIEYLTNKDQIRKSPHETIKAQVILIEATFNN